jgi:hypothetical protein
MVTSKKWLQRKLHTIVSGLRGRNNTCLTQRKDGSFAPKVDYKSQATAAKSALRLGEKWGKPFDAYQCFFCGGWHIGGAANLTFAKFFSILWIRVLGKRRAGNKHRLRPRRTNPVQCQRCGKETNVTIMSMFNTQEICMECKATEETRPDYNDAVKADETAIRVGDTHFKGIGLK